MGRIQLVHTYEDIISVENLLGAWREFIKGKRHKIDVQKFQIDLLNNAFLLHEDLKNKTYTHGIYHHFKINDPKPRDIHKATVRDRLLHHALYRKLYPFFDRTFIADSYSCREGKGTHRAFNRWLVREIVGSFNLAKEGVSLPLGNLTSQLFVNIYMNEFDQFMKHKLKVKYYIRYADDFVILHQDISG